MYYLLKSMLFFDETIKDFNNIDIQEEEHLKQMEKLEFNKEQFKVAI